MVVKMGVRLRLVVRVFACSCALLRVECVLSALPERSQRSVQSRNFQRWDVDVR